MKPSIAVVLGGKPKGKEEETDEEAPESEDGEHEDHETAAMDEFIAAVHAKDVEKACEAFETLCDLHGSYEDEDEDEDEEEKE